MDKRQREHSISRWKIFRGCPFAYKLIVLDKIPRAGDLGAMQEGKLLHEMTAAYLEHLLATKQASDLEWATGHVPPEANFRVRQTWDKWSSLFLMPAAIENPLVEARIALDRNFQRCPDFFRSPGLFFRLVVDFAFVQNGTTVVRDWKANLITVDSPLEDEQMAIYGWAISEETKTEEILLSLESLALGYRREATVLRKDLAHVPDMIREMAARVEENRKWDPTPGSFCSQCGVAHFCPEMERALIPRESLAPASAADALAAASLLLRLDTLRSLLGEQLKAWVAEFGAVQVGDMVYGPVPTSEPILPPEATVERLLAAGVPREKVWEIVTITKTNLSRVLKSKEVKRKELLDEILAEAETKDGAMVKFKKIKEGKSAGDNNGGNGGNTRKSGGKPKQLDLAPAPVSTGDSELDEILNAPKK